MDKLAFYKDQVVMTLRRTGMSLNGMQEAFVTAYGPSVAGARILHYGKVGLGGVGARLREAHFLRKCPGKERTAAHMTSTREVVETI